jgi:hypothetical protein
VPRSLTIGERGYGQESLRIVFVLAVGQSMTRRKREISRDPPSAGLAAPRDAPGREDAGLTNREIVHDAVAALS